METFSALLTLSLRWIPLTKGQRRGALMFSLIYAWTNRSASNRDAGDFRRHRSHYDVTVMTKRECEPCASFLGVVLTRRIQECAVHHFQQLKQDRDLLLHR